MKTVTASELKRISRLGRWLLVIAIGLAGGAILNLLHVPLAWMIGAITATAIASICFPSLALTPYARLVGQLAVGSSVGLSFSGAVIIALAGMLPLIIVATMSTILVSLIMSYALAHVARTDKTTAFFAAMPGGVAEMVTLAERYGGRPALVSLSQSLRILLAVICVPLLVSSFAPGGVSALPTLRHADWNGLIALFALAMGAGLFLNRLRVPNGFLLGGLVAGATFINLTDAVTGVPGIIVNAAQVLIGSSLGVRFKREALRGMQRFVVATILMTFAMISVAAILAYGLSGYFEKDAATLILAFAPGGAGEMGITALTVGADVTLVTTVHLIRIVMVALASVPLFKLASSIGHRP